MSAREIGGHGKPEPTAIRAPRGICLTEALKEPVKVDELRFVDGVRDGEIRALGIPAQGDVRRSSAVAQRADNRILDDALDRFDIAHISIASHQHGFTKCVAQLPAAGASYISELKNLNNN